MNIRRQFLTVFMLALWNQSVSKTDNFMIIELTLFPGRTKEQKSDAIKAITSRFGESLGIAPTDVFIVINEPSFEN